MGDAGMHRTAIISIVAFWLALSTSLPAQDPLGWLGGRYETSRAEARPALAPRRTNSSAAATSGATSGVAPTSFEEIDAHSGAGPGTLAEVYSDGGDYCLCNYTQVDGLYWHRVGTGCSQVL